MTMIPTLSEWYRDHFKIKQPDGTFKAPVIWQHDLDFLNVIQKAAELKIMPFIKNYSRKGPAYIVNPELEKHLNK